MATPKTTKCDNFCHICHKENTVFILLRTTDEGIHRICKNCIAKMLKAKNDTIFDI